MATEIICYERIADFGPAAVWDAATQGDTLPWLEGLLLEPHGERIGPKGEDSKLDIRLHFTKGVGRLAVQRNFEIPTDIVEYRRGKHLKLYGATPHIGEVTVSFDLERDKEQRGTVIQYGVLIEHHGPAKLLEGTVARHLRGDNKHTGVLAHFAAYYRENVEARLAGEPLPHPSAIHRKQKVT